MNERKGPKLTPRQRDVLTEIARLEELGEAVTTSRLGEHLMMPRQNVRMYLLALRTQGVILYVAGERQNAVIRLTPFGQVFTGSTWKPPDSGSFRTLGFPILGEVAAGPPGWAEERIEGYATRLQDILDLREGDFLLRVRVPGDDTATLKRWQRHNGTVSLLSENPEYLPMTFKVQDVQVQGCLVGLIGSGRARRTGNGNGR
jgi:repressor LexA